MRRRRLNAEPRAEPWFDRLRLANVRCFEDAEVPLDRHVTVIIGENGSGKTTVAEALASLSFGEKEGLPSFPERHDGSTVGEIALYEAGAEAPAARWVAGGERARLADSRYLFAYGRYRRVQLDAEATEQGLEADLLGRVRGRRTTTVFAADNHILRDLGPTLIALNQRRRTDIEAEAAWRALEEAVKGLGHGLTGLGVVERDGEDVVVVRRRGTELPLRELSDGYQAMLVIVLDLAIRYPYLSPLPEPMRRPATVVIDEVDLHLHPRWQRKVVRQLTTLFPETQFILTTHSPAVVQGAIDDGHEVLVLREDGGAGSVRALSEKERRALQGAQLGSVVVDKHLFGVASRYSSKIEATEQRARRLRKKLEAGTATEEDREALLRALERLEMLTANEEERWAGAPVFREITRVQIASLKELAALTKEARDGRDPSPRGD